MKKTRVLPVFLMILYFSTSYAVLATEDIETTYGPELHVGIFGASIAGLRRTGFVISNNGDAPILDIHWVFSIKSIANDEIDYRYSDELEVLNVYSANMFMTNEVNGVGLVTLSATVSSSNAGNKTISIYGFQIGPYTISRPWILAWDYG